jgi:hypothetical protein
MTDPIDPLALDRSPAQAFAGDKAGVKGIARFFAQTCPLDTVNKKAEENYSITLPAYLCAASDDPNVKVCDKVSLDHIPAAPWPCARNDSAIVL